MVVPMSTSTSETVEMVKLHSSRRRLRKSLFNGFFPGWRTRPLEIEHGDPERSRLETVDVALRGESVDRVVEGNERRPARGSASPRRG
jgi:hypothetical protein